jgi:peptidoglycan/LPS O-acetylase OafA/YrhL
VLELAANLLHAALLRHLGTRRLGWLVAISALLVFAASLHWGGLDLGWQRETFLPGLARVLFGFFGGVWLYRTRERWQARVPRTPLAVPALALMLATGFGRSAGELTWLYDPVMTLLVLPCLLMLGARAKGGRVASALGTLSFPLYAIHLQTLEGLHAWGASQPLLWIAAVLLVAISWLIGGLIDEPLSAWFRLRRRMRGQRGALVVA